MELSGKLRARLCVGVRPEWAAACTAHLQATCPDFDRWSEDTLLERVFEQILTADLNVCGQGGAIPDLKVRKTLAGLGTRALAGALPLTSEARSVTMELEARRRSHSSRGR